MINTANQTDRWALIEDFWNEAESGHRAARSRRTTSVNFYKGKQWTAEDLNTLDEQKRPALTFNFIKPTIRNTVGYFIQNRQDLKYLARRGGNAMLAEIWTEAVKYLFDNCDADWAQRFAFFYGLIGNKGWLMIDIDYTRDIINGDFVIRCEDADAVYEDPANRSYDVNDGLFVFRVSWKTKEEIEAEFPKTGGSEIDTSAQALPEGEQKIMEYEDDPDKRETYADPYAQPSRGKRLMLKECWWKSFKKLQFLVNTRTLEVLEVKKSLWSKIKSLIPKLSTLLNSAGLPTASYQTLERTVPVLNITTYLGNLELQHKSDPFNGVTMFPMVRFCPDWVNGVAKSEVDDLVDPQKEYNKRYSQILHHLNMSVNSGLIADSDCFGGEDGSSSWTDVERFMSKPGVILRARPGKRWQFIQPTQISEGHLTLAKVSQENIRYISGVLADMRGEVSEKGLSGVAIAKRTMQGLTTMEPVHDNWRYTFRILGRTILEYLRRMDILTIDEILAIVNEKKIAVQGREELEKLLKNRAIGKYGTAVATSISTPLIRLANFETLLEAWKEKLPIPAKMLIKNSALAEADKEEIIKEMETQEENKLAMEKAASRPAVNAALPGQDAGGQMPINLN